MINNHDGKYNVNAAILYWEAMIYGYQTELTELAEDSDMEDMTASKESMEKICTKMMTAEHIIKRLKKINDE
jgi:hypothetical protein